MKSEVANAISALSAAQREAPAVVDPAIVWIGGIADLGLVCRAPP
jgi:hypothetical protein